MIQCFLVHLASLVTASPNLEEFYEAAKRGHYDILMKMKERWPDKVDLTAVLPDGRNILHLAAGAGKTEFFEQIRIKDKDNPLWSDLLVQPSGPNKVLPMHAAAFGGHYDTLKKMRQVWPDKVDLTAVLPDGRNILHLAAGSGRTGFFEQIRINDRNNLLWATLLVQPWGAGQWLPMHAAAFGGHYDTLLKMKQLWPDRVDLTAVSSDELIIGDDSI
jgi:ankyrin repeat protein